MPIVEKNIRVVIVEPGKPPRAETIPNELEAMQKIVGGYIRRHYFEPSRRYNLVVNDDGLAEQLPLNFYLNGYPIVGTVFITATRGSEFRSLTDIEIVEIMEIFRFKDRGSEA